MRCSIQISDRLLHFRQPAGTSRGVYTTRHSYFLTLTSADSPGIAGVGECAPLPDLSCDAIPEYGRILEQVCRLVEQMGQIPYDMLRPYPSILFGLETAFAQFRAGGSPAFFDTPFSRGEEGIPINGLVWMGSYKEMCERLEAKLQAGYHCVKLKIGAIDFGRELDLIRRIRDNFTREQVELRVDANGGFTPDNALQRLEALARYDIHSIEQPIRQHQWADMARLCKDSPLPIALDEELIGVNVKSMKEALLETIQPQYIVLKPSLHGGMFGSSAWHWQLDNVCFGEQCGAECHRPILRKDVWPLHNHAARTGHWPTLCGQRTRCPLSGGDAVRLSAHSERRALVSIK